MYADVLKKLREIEEPWDGVWNEELIFHLTVGVTRKRGSVRVKDAWGKTVVVECSFPERDGYVLWARPVVEIDGLPMKIWEAVRALREAGAVPVNDDGTQWEVRRKERREGDKQS